MANLDDLKPILEQLRQRIGMMDVPFVRKIEAGALVKFARATGQTDLHYLDEEFAAKSRFGALIAVPTFISTLLPDKKDLLFVFDLPLPLFLHSDDVAHLGEPIRAGDIITGHSRYADAFLREGGRGAMVFQQVDMHYTNQHGQNVGTVSVKTVSF